MYKTLLRLIKISSNYFPWMLLAAVTGFLTVGSSVGLLMTSAYIISKAALQASFAELFVAVAGVRFFGVFRGVFRYAERMVSHEVTFKLLGNFRVWFFRCLEPLVPAKTIRHKSGELLNRFVADVEELKNLFLRILAPPLIALLILLLMWFLLGMFNPGFSIIFISYYLAAAFFIPVLAYKASFRTGIRIVNIRKELQVKSVELVQGMAELAVYDTDNRHIVETEKLNSELTSLQQKMAVINGLAETMVGLLMNAAVITLLVFGIKAVNAETMDGVYLSVIVIGVMASFEALLTLPAAFQNLSKTSEASAGLFEIIDTASPETHGLKKPVSSSDIVFKNVSFTYKKKKVLKNISLNIPAGSKIAIAGPSGSGKTSIVNLMLHLWKTDEGEISFGGTNISEIDEIFLRSRFSVMNQDCFLFNRTLKDNLLLGKTAAKNNEIQIAITQSNLSDKINNLPLKLDSFIGEQGLLLSGGERQRLCLARAFIKDAQVYIFDEPAVNLDSENERDIFNSIFNLRKDKTVIIISHKLKYLKQADYIYYLDKGIINEEGVFDELMKKNSLFKSVYDLQNQIIDLSF